MGFVFRDHVRGQNAAPEYVRINHRAAAEDAAGVQHGVAAGFRAVAQQRAEFAQAGVEGFSVNLDKDISGHQFEIGNFHARAEVRLVAEDGVADIIEVRHLRAVEEERVLQLGRIADDAAVADDDVLAEIGIVANLAIPADDGRAFDHRAGFNQRAFADENFFADARARKSFGRGLFRHLRDVGFNFRQRFPCEFAAVEDGGVFGLREVKQVGWLEHGARLMNLSASAK